MRRTWIACSEPARHSPRPIAYQQKQRSDPDEPLPFMRAYQPRKAAIEAIPDLKSTLESPDQPKPSKSPSIKAQSAILDALSQTTSANANNRRKPHAENTRSKRTRLDLRSSISIALATGGQSRDLLYLASLEPFIRPIFGLKGRRHLLSRNDFNWQRRETARIATLSQHIAFRRLNGAPANFLANRSPPPCRVRGAGGGERSHGPN